MKLTDKAEHLDAEGTTSQYKFLQPIKRDILAVLQKTSKIRMRLLTTTLMEDYNYKEQYRSWPSFHSQVSAAIKELHAEGKIKKEYETPDRGFIKRVVVRLS